MVEENICHTCQAIKEILDKWQKNRIYPPDDPEELINKLVEAYNFHIETINPILNVLTKVSLN